MITVAAAAELLEGYTEAIARLTVLICQFPATRRNDGVGNGHFDFRFLTFPPGTAAAAALHLQHSSSTNFMVYF
ncbi:hypothetical protein LINGRAHAP2_LOCUS33228 [Linum grandiflorum]